MDDYVKVRVIAPDGVSGNGKVLSSYSDQEIETEIIKKYGLNPKLFFIRSIPRNEDGNIPRDAILVIDRVDQPFLED